MGSSDLEAVGAAPHDLIAQKSRDHIGAYLETRDRWNAASSLKALTDAAAREYEDRFLIELIQNGYDAHLAEKRDGRIVIRLARDEGEHGTIYVANGGTPFTESNFNALCEIAQSDKKPGESVGHKGVGFTSVLQVCAWPEIYSGDEAQRLSGSLGGFCFGFAKPEDVLKLTEGDETAAQAVVHDISPYFLPIPLEHKPQAVRQLANEGLATVVRLPLESEVALQVAEEQIRFLRQSKAPLMLFLERLDRLDIVTTGGGRPSEMTALTRRAEQLRPQPLLGGGRLELVDLGHQGRWLLASRAVDEARLKKALAESVDSGQIDEAWTDWTAPAVVSVATRSDADEVDPQMYTFLPMGKHAPAPFWGHLNAPFSTKLARLDINDRVPLNALFLGVPPLSWTPERLVGSVRPGGKDAPPCQGDRISRSRTRRSFVVRRSRCIAAAVVR